MGRKPVAYNNSSRSKMTVKLMLLIIVLIYIKRCYVQTLNPVMVKIVKYGLS